MKRSVVLLSLLCLASLNVRADWQGEAKADFAVKATMDSFVGKATSEPIALAADATELPVTFQIAKLDTGKKKRDVEMQHMFHMEQHPELTGVAKLADLSKLEGAGDVPVSLTIAGVTQELTAHISDVKRTDGKWSFTAQFDISLKTFGLKPPSIMKIINVGDVVKVTTRFSLLQTTQP